MRFQWEKAAMIPTQRFPVVDWTEKRVLTFDFSKDLAIGESLSGTPSVTVTVDLGTDPNPQNTVTSGPVISGATVLMTVSGFVQGTTDYRYTVRCPTSNTSKILVLAWALPVRVL